MNSRPYQDEAFAALTKRRLFGLLWERQAGKSTTLAKMAFALMMAIKNHTCVYASASLLLSREIVMKLNTSVEELIRSETKIFTDLAASLTGEAEKNGLKLETADARDHKVLTGLKPDDFADLFQAQRLEFRVYHSRTGYSRCQVIAPNPATARGWSGTVFLDEIGFIRDFQELWTAVEPIISTQKKFRAIFSTTPPQDDTHYSFEMLSAPAGMEFAANARGNWYESEAGVPVHRADCFDTALAGKKVFDVKTGAEITPQQAFAKAINKDAHRLNHQLVWMIGGTAACDLLRLKSAQERGAGQCQCVVIDSDGDFDAAMKWLAGHLDAAAPVGVGMDVATTTKGSSNPSVVAITEGHGVEMITRQVLVWKTRNPALAEERLDSILDTIAARGARARALAIDATNEKYWAERQRVRLAGKVPVLLVVSSETVDKPGLEKATNYKSYLGDQHVSRLEDNRLTLPPEVYFRADHRLVKKDRGLYVCEPDAEGRHGDTFDACKLSEHALVESPGGILDASAIRHGGQGKWMTRFRPRRLAA